MKLQVEVLACDVDKKFPAKTYTVTASDGRSISADLCAEHAAPFEQLLEEATSTESADGLKPDPERRETEEGGLDEKKTEVAPQPEPAPAAPKQTSRRTATKKVAAKKTATKKASAKKATPSRRRPRITSLEEIEARKQG
ncbi:hypothetical protein [Streptomyces sp. NPDC048057]|uniref:hypothetical protein n=1 Tax=Streptomyces sp. NPDC048057 TaxID=3155628 RepID=UPI00340DD286